MTNETVKSCFNCAHRLRPTSSDPCRRCLSSSPYAATEWAPADEPRRVDLTAAAIRADLRAALQWLLDDLHDAGALTDDAGRICDSARNAGRALLAAGGSPPFPIKGEKP